jgi:lipoic acid synthetase
VTELVQISPARTTPAPKPEWLKARAPVGENYHSLKQLARSLHLNTVCESAHCPNIGECWHHKTATFMMLGNLCTRRCGFCAVPKGRPEPIDFDEPRRVAEAVAKLGLLHAVVTSVNRDDDLLGGARAFALVIEEIRRQAPDCRVEVLIPDFQGNPEAIRAVVDARPEVLNHNTESVPRLYRVVRSGARYERTLELLRYAKELNPAGHHKIRRHGWPRRRDRPSCSKSSAIWPQSTATSSPSANICDPRAITCPWPASTPRASLPN